MRAIPPSHTRSGRLRRLKPLPLLALLSALGLSGLAQAQTWSLTNLGSSTGSISGTDPFTISNTNGNQTTSDSETFYWTTLPGDGSVTVEVTGISGATTPFIQMRASNASNAAQIQLQAGYNNGAYPTTYYRATTGANDTLGPYLGNQGAYPIWLRIVRSGTSFSEYYSKNGTSYTQIGSAVSVPALSGALTIGVGVSGGATTTSSTFSQLATTGTATVGSLSASSSSVSCPSTSVGSTSTCGTVTLTASGGAVTLGATPLSLTDSVNFTVPNGTCTANLALSTGSSCTTGTIVFSPTYNGSLTNTVTANATTGSGTTFNVSGSVSGSACTNVDIGSPAVAGSGSLSGATYTLSGNGTIWNASDQFHMCYWQLTGDGSITARVKTQSGGSTYQEAGVMFRNSLAANDVHADTVYITGYDVQGQTRNAANPNGLVAGSALSPGALPMYVRVTRVGSSFNEYYSTTGSSWTLLGTSSVAMGNTAYVGLVASSQNTTTLSTDTFDSVSITQTPVGTTTTNVSSLACGNAGVGTSGTCASGTITITANGGDVLLGSTPFSSSDTSDFTVPAGTCANANLAAGQSCNSGTVLFNPASLGALSSTVTITPTSGSTATVSLSGTGTYGSATVSTSGMTCSGTVGLSSACTGSATITATAGPIVLNATPITLSGSNAADFTVNPGTCASTTLASGASCTLGTVTFSPAASGSRSVTLNASLAHGTAGSASLSGTASGAGTASITGFSNCTGGIGVASTCPSNITVTATGGTIELGSTLASLSGANPSDFALAYTATGACTANQILSSGSSCAIGPVTFTAGAAGTRTANVTLTPAVGAAGSAALTGTGNPGTATVSVSGVSCSQTVGLGAASCTGTAVINVTGGQVTLNGTPVTLSGTNASDFSVAGGTCSYATVAAGSYCNLGTISFTPAATGTRTASLTASLSAGTAGAAAVLAGTGVSPGSLTLTSVSNCSALVGSTTSCPSQVTVTATNGAVQLGNTLTSLSGANASEFTSDTTVSGACTASQVLSSGASCVLGIKFSPTAPGTRTATLAVATSVGTGASTSLSGIAYSLTSNAASLSCGNQGAGVPGTNNCGSVTLTANGAAITLGNPFVAFSDSHFSLGTSTCSNAQVLAAGSSCSFAVSFSPTNLTGYSGNATVASSASTQVVALSGQGSWGAVSVPASATCGSVGAGQGSTNCQSVTITAVNGPIRFGASPYSSTNAAFAVTSDTCAGNTLQVGQTCAVTYAFAPTSVGAAQSTVTVTPTFGGASSFTLSGTGSAGTLSAATEDCGSSTVGVSTSCAAITVSAAGGPVVLSNSLITNTNPGEFDVTAGTCTAGGTLASGSSCRLNASFTAAATGARSASLTVNASSGTSATFTLTGTGYTYGWQNGAWSAPSSSCSTSATETRSVTCIRNDGTSVADSFCSGTKPAAIQTVSSLSGCTFSWQSNAFGSCSGGTGSWQYSSWTPATGCGSFSQSRTGSCVANSNSGTATRTVSCLRSDGTTVDNGQCASATMPATTQACTPTSGFSCGTEDVLTQTTTDTSTCSYSWNVGTWSGTSSQCSGTATQSRSVTCLQSDGETVSDALCSSAGTKPATSQSVADYSACTFSWQQGGFPSTCSGGTGSWQYTSWAPATGCGQNLTQTRLGSCVANANSVTQTQTVTCLRSDGTTVDNSQCANATMPSLTQTCTPTSGFSCGTEGALSQTFSDTSTCSYSWNVGAWSASSNTCSASATQTRTVSCQQSDGETVPDGLCSSVGTKPATSQTVADFSSCTYRWTASGFGACSGGTGTWSYTSWTPATACGSVTQTRSGSCSADTNSGTQTQTVSCERSDGTVVDNTHCDAALQPALSQACTPTSGYTCATEGALSQTVNLTNGCVYGWVGGNWSSCTGGTGNWTYSTWAPAAGTSCTTSLVQSREGTCIADTNSGTQTRAVTCQDQNGDVVDNSLCTGTPLPASESCTPATGFSCGDAGALEQTVTDLSDCGYTWQVGAWSASSNTCSATATQTRSVNCLRSDNTAVADSFCSGAGNKPAISQTVADFSTCTFSWKASGFGACTGGTGTWTYTSWTPASGCGTVSQSRTGTCSVNTNSGIQTQTVSCVRSDGATVDNNNCSANSEPALTQACTPTSGFSCGAEAALTQSVTLTNACTYSWVGGNWSACTGGAGAWQYTQWTPAVGSACTNSLVQTRSGTCVATANSGSQSRPVTCQDQNGNVVAGSLCSGTALPTTQSCTPTTGFSCGTEGALSQTVADTSTCSYSWTTGAWSACTGGSGAWQYSAWTPSCGVGPTTQTRTATCAATAASGSQTRSVACTRTDGTVVANGLCSGAAPAASATCTPSTGFSCGTQGTLAQKVTLTKPCTN